MRTLDKILTKSTSKYGAPMGRSSYDERIDKTQKIFDCKVTMSSCGAYDSGGHYFGYGAELRVKYTKNISLVWFYRIDDKPTQFN